MWWNFTNLINRFKECKLGTCFYDNELLLYHTSTLNHRGRLYSLLNSRDSLGQSWGATQVVEPVSSLMVPDGQEQPGRVMSGQNTSADFSAVHVSSQIGPFSLNTRSPSQVGVGGGSTTEGHWEEFGFNIHVTGWHEADFRHWEVMWRYRNKHGHVQLDDLHVHVRTHNLRQAMIWAIRSCLE